ncbi:cytochrome P450 4C1-like [Parasteatoda tepidariorum]|uniref:cytochrome P450 4C1-like n=1 Tax=Parasteatoda tepidariorum TaxID=114398 RepID=UPI001C725D9B|nr:cytochrome P450 4C1-like [Parasteatoda tepidariorum]
MLAIVSTSVLYAIIKCIIVLALLAYIFYATLYLPRKLVNGINKLPSLGLGLFYPAGHAILIKPQRFQKLIAPVHVYDFASILGYNVLFSKHGISNFWQFLIPFVSVFRADTVEAVLNHNNEIKKSWVYNFLHPWLGLGLLTSYDEKWRHRRKLLTPAFHFNILKDFQYVFNKQSKILVNILDKHSKEKYVDILPIVTRCGLDIICESVLGAEMHTQTKSTSPYVKGVIELGNLFFQRALRPWLWIEAIYPYFPSGRQFLKTSAIVHEFTDKLISERKQAKLERRMSSEDSQGSNESSYKRKKRALLDLLLDEHIENNSISETEIREEVDTFTFEGHDTTSIAMSWTLYLIGLHPWVQDKVHEELDSIFGESDREVDVDDIKDMKYLECVVKESMRLYPSVSIFGREIRDDLQCNEYVIPQGSMCYVNVYLLHRDSKVFPNPEKFDPDRFSPENSAGRHPFAYVPFSAGPRNCIGQRFAFMEIKTVVSSVLRKFKVKSLDPRDRVNVMDEIILRPEGELRLQIRKRSDDFDFKTVYYYP